MTASYLERGHGVPLVFLHGVGGDASAWEPQLAFFAPWYRCIAWNLPGYAGSTPLPKTRFSTLAKALADLLDTLTTGSVHLVGHSLGGMIAQEFIAAYPDRVRTLTLSATSPAFGKADGDWQREFLAARLGPLEQGATMAELAPAIVQKLIGPAPDPAGVTRAIACMSAIAPDAYRAAVTCLLGFDRRADLARITVPTLVIAGRHDGTAPALMMETMAKRIPQGEFLCLEHAGHLLTLERPHEFNAALNRFLQQHDNSL